jgi:hypothetical protein
MAHVVWYKSAVRLVILYNYQLNSINITPLRRNCSCWCWEIISQLISQVLCPQQSLPSIIIIIWNMLTWMIYCIIFSSFTGSDEIVEDNRCFNDLKKCTKLADKHTHLICGQLIKRKFPQCAPANLETSCLLKIGDFSRKLRLHCSCQFSWYALTLNELNINLQGANHLVIEMFDKIPASHRKLQLWKLQLNNMTKFPILRMKQPNTVKHMEEIRLQQQFNSHFQDMRHNELIFTLTQC